MYIKDAGGKEVDVGDLGQRDWPDAFELFTQETQDACHELPDLVAKEVGQLIVTLADVAAKHGQQAPYIRVDVREVAKNVSTVKIAMSGVDIPGQEQVAFPTDGIISAYAKLWREMTDGMEDSKKIAVTLQMMVPLQDLHRAMVHEADSDYRHKLLADVVPLDPKDG